MEIQEITPLVDLLALLIPRESEQEIEQIKVLTKNSKGEFRMSVRPSDCLTMIKAHRQLKAAIEAAQLEGKTEI